jgi:hypothetical protein
MASTADKYICLEKRTGKKVSCNLVAKNISGIMGIGAFGRKKKTTKKKTTTRRKRR